jgi:RNA polymerase sigma-70 factor, ECF subfamily
MASTTQVARFESAAQPSNSNAWGMADSNGKSLTKDQDSEMALIRRIVNGDHDAFYQLLKPYERMIFTSALGVLNNEADAEEVAQEAILKAFRALARFRGESKFSTWIVQITVNEARMRVRKYRPQLHESLDEPTDLHDGEYVPKDFADWRDIPSEALEKKQLRDALREAVAALPEKYRQVVVLRDVNHMSTRDTAEALGIQEANVKTRLLRARLMLRDALAGKQWFVTSGQ